MYVDGVPATVETGLRLVVESGISLASYSCYMHLRRSGLIVARPGQWAETRKSAAAAAPAGGDGNTGVVRHGGEQLYGDGVEETAAVLAARVEVEAKRQVRAERKKAAEKEAEGRPQAGSKKDKAKPHKKSAAAPEAKKVGDAGVEHAPAMSKTAMKKQRKAQKIADANRVPSSVFTRARASVSAFFRMIYPPVAAAPPQASMVNPVVEKVRLYDLSQDLTPVAPVDTSAIPRAVTDEATPWNVEPEFGIDWHVWRSGVQNSSKKFRKTAPGKPSFCVSVARFQGRVPSLPRLKTLFDACDGSPLRFAIVDYGNVIFFDMSQSAVPFLDQHEPVWTPPARNK